MWKSTALLCVLIISKQLRHQYRNKWYYTHHYHIPCKMPLPQESRRKNIQSCTLQYSLVCHKHVRHYMTHSIMNLSSVNWLRSVIFCENSTSMISPISVYSTTWTSNSSIHEISKHHNWIFHQQVQVYIYRITACMVSIGLCQTVPFYYVTTCFI